MKLSPDPDKNISMVEKKNLQESQIYWGFLVNPLTVNGSLMYVLATYVCSIDWLI